MDDFILIHHDKEYLKYLKSFTETRLDKNRNFPKISPYVNGAQAVACAP